jgi:hypothetical protein
MAEIWHKYPEIYHYTKADGLQGILTSQILFATQYDHLNDSSELNLLRNALPRFVEPTVRQFQLDRWHASATVKREIRKAGGVAKASAQIVDKI